MPDGFRGGITRRADEIAIRPEGSFLPKVRLQELLIGLPDVEGGLPLEPRGNLLGRDGRRGIHQHMNVIWRTWVDLHYVNVVEQSLDLFGKRLVVLEQFVPVLAGEDEVVFRHELAVRRMMIF